MDRNAFEAAAAAGLGKWPAGTVFLAAVSGGADSSAMLAALAALRDNSFELRCLHVEHGIRSAAESRSDAAAVEALCAALAVPCKVVSIPPGKIARTAQSRGIGLEAAARLSRHGAWTAAARRVTAEKVLGAHPRNELLETALMRILRGSGPAGLAAMPREKGRVLRPLLGLGRGDVLAYLEARGIPYCVDSTNADPAFLRNRIRLKLIPCLDEFFPSWQKTLADLAETQRLVSDFLEAEAAARIVWEEDGAEPRLAAHGEGFFSQPAIIREEALFAALDRFAGGRGLKPPRRKNLRVLARGEAGSLDLGKVMLKNRRGRVLLEAPRSGERGFSLLIKGPGIYKLKRLTVRVFPFETGNVGESPFPVEGPGFFACPPVALRQYYPGDVVLQNGRKRRGTELGNAAELITAEDVLGPAAFIAGGRGGSAAVLAGEDKNRSKQENCLFIIIEEREQKRMF
jgi:tRNA(Ile)-lysidine synthase